MRQKQIDESRNLIQEGFFELLENKQYSKISMSEIAEVSTVTRMTLYRHFKSKEEILKLLIVNLVDSIKECYLKQEDRSISKLLLIRNEMISRNKYLKIAISNSEVEPLVREFVMYGRNMFVEYLGLKTSSNQYISEFVIGGIEAITTNWVLGGLKESSEKVTRETLQILKLIIDEL